MKKIIKVLVVIVLIISLTCVFLVNKNIFKENKKGDLINISELSEEFMDDYFEETKEIKEEDKENILIVISDEKPVDTGGF